MLVTIFCVKCGMKLADGAAFCHSCGSHSEPPVPVDSEERERESAARTGREEEAATKQEIGLLVREYKASHDEALVGRIRQLKLTLQKPKKPTESQTKTPASPVAKPFFDTKMKNFLKVAFAIVCFLFLIRACGGPTNTVPPSPDNSSMAIVMCRDQVKKELRAPSTADFGGESVVSPEGGGYAVLGWVDAQNSFGVKLRSAYSCGATYMGNGQWEIYVHVK
jgi:hypothetical protein